MLYPLPSSVVKYNICVVSPEAGRVRQREGDPPPKERAAREPTDRDRRQAAGASSNVRVDDQLT
jgi:hypothetical protein